MDQQYRDALNNARDDEINQACEAEAEREVKTIYDSAAEVHPAPSHAPPAPHLAAIQVTRRANYRAQHLRELAWREEQQQAHIAKEMEAEVSSNPALAATHRLSCTVARQLRVSRARIKGFAGLYSAVDSSLYLCWIAARAGGSTLGRRGKATVARGTAGGGSCTRQVQPPSSLTPHHLYHAPSPQVVLTGLNRTTSKLLIQPCNPDTHRVSNNSIVT